MIFAGGRRFNSLVTNLKDQFGGRVQKVSVHAGFTCPNRDGTKGKGGCEYCDNLSFTPSYCHQAAGIAEQLDKGIAFLRRRYKNPALFLAYFQSYSNTYGSVSDLKDKYEQALSHPQIDGLVISTRPDCLPDEVLDYLSELSKKCHLMLEIGIESTNDDTLTKMNRCHTWLETVNAIKRAVSKGLTTGGHLILGLPGESKSEMISAADIISDLPLDYLKLHQFQVSKHSRIGKKYLTDPDPYPHLEIDEYIDLVISFLERLNPAVQMDRLSGEQPPDFSLGPQWSIRSDQLLQLIEQKMESLDTWQGRYYQKEVKNEPEFTY